jgi:hypothetical protein
MRAEAAAVEPAAVDMGVEERDLNIYDRLIEVAS